MLSYRSKRHPINFYLTVAGSTVFFLLLAVYLIFFVKSGPDYKGKLPAGFAPVFGIIILFVGWYLVRTYLRSTPAVEIDGEFILIGRENWHRSALVSVDLSSKASFEFFGYYTFPATEFKFSDNSKRYVFDFLYSTTPELKLLLQADKTLQRQVERRYQPASLNLGDDVYQDYKGNAVFSFRGVMLWMFPVVAVWMLFSDWPDVWNKGTAFFVGFSLCWVCLHSFMLYYFRIGEFSLQVRNHYFFWIRKTIPFEEIEEISYSSGDRIANGLRITYRTFRTKTFRAGSLTDAQWLALAKTIRSSNIKFRKL
ncbi:MAG: hypothetical protein EOO09_11770 [Chitinophagaceae bacterium]|nr:MAG: hypothetical protein EOO09_11770 [Chitinophagaceae bacterium]